QADVRALAVFGREGVLADVVLVIDGASLKLGVQLEFRLEGHRDKPPEGWARILPLALGARARGRAPPGGVCGQPMSPRAADHEKPSGECRERTTHRGESISPDTRL